jgi:hypothetical protein
MMGFDEQVNVAMDYLEMGDCEGATLFLERSRQLLQTAMHHYEAIGRPTDTDLWDQLIDIYAHLDKEVGAQCGIHRPLSD